MSEGRRPESGLDDRTIDAVGERGAERLPWGAAMLAALLATLARPWSWAVALAGFLARGGILLVALPIVVVPTTPGLAIAIAPVLTPFYFGQVSVLFVLLVGALSATVAVSIVAGGLVGAWTDTVLARDAAADEELGVAVVPAGSVVRRVLAARLVAHLPLALALAWGAVRIVGAAYREVILPEELATPIVLRVLLAVPETVALVAAAWLAGETIGGLAGRRIAVVGASVGAGLGWALGCLVRAPRTTLATLLVTTALVAVAVVPPALAAGVAWHRAGLLLAAGGRPAEVAAAVGLFVALWLVALVLAGVATAFRSFAWTFEAFRPDGAGHARGVAESAGRPRTIGGHERGRPGEWPSADGSGRL